MSGYARNIISGNTVISGYVAFLKKPVVPAKLFEAIGKKQWGTRHDRRSDR